MAENSGSETRITHGKRLRKLPSKVNDQQSDRMTNADKADGAWALVEAIDEQNRILVTQTTQQVNASNRVISALDRMTRAIDEVGEKLQTISEQGPGGV